MLSDSKNISVYYFNEKLKSGLVLCTDFHYTDFFQGTVSAIMMPNDIFSYKETQCYNTAGFCICFKLT